jgi:rfaE bifunctional protein kinase chain/domain
MVEPRLAPPPTLPAVEDVLATLSGGHVVVMGDLCLDTYWEVDSRLSEQSVETGLPTIPVTGTRYSLGGACNVAANLSDLGVGYVEVIGLVGADPFAELLRARLRAAGVGTDHVWVQDTQWHTHTYVKVMEGGREGNRIDFGNANVLCEESREAMLAGVRDALRRASCLVINQQVRSGIHDAAMRRALARLISSEVRIPVLVDSRRFPDDYSGAIRKLNTREARALLAVADGGEQREKADAATVAHLAADLQRRWNRPVVVTRGGNGCLVCRDEAAVAVPAVRRPGAVDPVGAGDSLLAGIAAALAAGVDLVEGVWLGTLAAGVTVTKLGRTGTATPEEVRLLAKELSEGGLSV